MRSINHKPCKAILPRLQNKQQQLNVMPLKCALHSLFFLQTGSCTIFHEVKPTWPPNAEKKRFPALPKGYWTGFAQIPRMRIMLNSSSSSFQLCLSPAHAQGQPPHEQPASPAGPTSATGPEEGSLHALFLGEKPNCGLNFLISPSGRSRDAASGWTDLSQCYSSELNFPKFGNLQKLPKHSLYCSKVYIANQAVPQKNKEVWENRVSHRCST